MANVQRLEVQHRRIGKQISKYEEKEYAYSGMEHDQLFEASYNHEGGRNVDCAI